LDIPTCVARTSTLEVARSGCGRGVMLRNRSSRDAYARSRCSSAQAVVQTRWRQRRLGGRRSGLRQGRSIGPLERSVNSLISMVVASATLRASRTVPKTRARATSERNRSAPIKSAAGRSNRRRTEHSISRWSLTAGERTSATNDQPLSDHCADERVQGLDLRQANHAEVRRWNG
jgi:hypothetical protein